jgi:hypothetical protein
VSLPKIIWRDPVILAECSRNGIEAGGMYGPIGGSSSFSGQLSLARSNAVRYYSLVIRSFRDRDTERLFHDYH